MQILLIAFVLMIRTSAFASETKWVFINTNDQKAEVATATKLAGGRDSILVFKNSDEFEEHLKTNPSLKISTLILSGHASGYRFSRGNISISRISSLYDKYPAMQGIDTLHALGCQTGTTSYMRLWGLALPSLKIFNGFDGSGPAGSVSADVFKKIEESKSALLASSDLKNFKDKTKKLFSWKSNPVNGAIGIFSGNPKKLLYSSHKSGAHDIDMSTNALKDTSICKQAANNILAITGESTPRKSTREAEEEGIDEPSVIPAIFAYIINNYGLNGVDLYSPQAVNFLTKQTFNQEGDVAMGSAIGYEKTSTIPVRNLPWAADQNSDVRKIYGNLHRLADCPQEFFLLDPVGKRLGMKDASYIENAVTVYINMIHSNEVILNLERCDRPFLDALKTRIQKCFSASPNAQTVISGLQKKPLTRETLIAAAEFTNERWKEHPEFKVDHAKQNFTVELRLATRMQKIINTDASISSVLWEPLSGELLAKACAKSPFRGVAEWLNTAECESYPEKIKNWKWQPWVGWPVPGVENRVGDTLPPPLHE